jgi:hypothetical protein
LNLPQLGDREPSAILFVAIYVPSIRFTLRTIESGYIISAEWIWLFCENGCGSAMRWSYALSACSFFLAASLLAEAGAGVLSAILSLVAKKDGPQPAKKILFPSALSV